MDELLTTDSCLKGGAAFCHDQYFHVEYPAWVFGWLENVHIAHLEMLAVLVAISIWKQKIRSVKFAMGCDSEAGVTVINSGRSRNQLLHY